MRTALIALLLSWPALPAVAAGADDPPAAPERVLEEAHFRETALFDAEGARDLYREVLGRPRLPARLAALAHLRLGVCLRLLGSREEGDAELRAAAGSQEEDAAKTARRLLGEARRDPARFMPPEAVLYAEVVEPGEQVGFLSDLIRGTPLENPVDTYLLGGPPAGAAAGRASGGGAHVPQVDQIRAILNLNLLRELQRLEGIALGVTSFDEKKPGWLVVLFPGTSELSRVVLKAVIPGAMDAGEPEEVAGMRLFRLQKEPLAVAMDGREDVVLFGPRDDVVAASLRGARERGEAAGTSLAERQDFREAQASRTGCMLFTYADRERLLAALRSATPADRLASFDEVRRFLGLDALRAVSATLSRSGDDLRIRLHAKVDPAGHALLAALRTPPFRPGPLPYVAPDALLFLSTEVSDGEDRWRRLKELLGPFLERLDGGKGGAQALEVLASGLDVDLPREVLAPLRRATAVLPARLAFPPQLSFYLVLEFEDGDRAAPVVERALAAAARRALGAGIPAAFADQKPAGAVRVRGIEPSPGFRLVYGRDGPLFILSPLEAVVRSAAALGRGGAAVPPLASKVLAARPDALRRAAGETPAAPAGPDRLLDHLARAVLTSEEGADGLALELRLPGAAPAIRETLREVTARVPAPPAVKVGEEPRPASPEGR